MAEQLQIRWIPIRGDSMWPALRTGDRARCEPLDRPPRKGDVVVARIAGALVAHRVISVGARVALQGDNCAVADPEVAPGELWGRITEVKRGVSVLPAERWDHGRSRLGRLRLVVLRRWRALAARAGIARHADALRRER